MNVETILQSKGNAVATVAAEAPLSAAVAILNERRIGAVVVVDSKGRVTGILSERDIVRRLGRDPATLLAAPVRNAMTSRVITVGRSETIDELMETMSTNRIRHLPVVEDDQLVGIVSIGDVVKRKIEQAELEASALKEYIAS